MTEFGDQNVAATGSAGAERALTEVESAHAPGDKRVRRGSTLHNCLLIFLGGCCYGAVGSVTKHAFAAGYTPQEIVFTQMFFGWIIFSVCTLIWRLKTGELYWPKKKDVRDLLIAGVATCFTSLFYSLALERLPASVAITLLFQFTWLGIVLEFIVTKRYPGTAKVIAGCVIALGTLAASGLLSSLLGLAGAKSLGALDPLGICFGCLSALCSCTYLYLTGKAACNMHVTQRAFFITLGATLTVLVVHPSALHAFSHGVDLIKYALFLSICAIAIPLYLFASAAPWLPNGVVSIMASSELPASVTCAALLLGERLDKLRIVGIVIILLGVIISQLSAIKSFFKSSKT